MSDTTQKVQQWYIPVSRHRCLKSRHLDMDSKNLIEDEWWNLKSSIYKPVRILLQQWHILSSSKHEYVTLVVYMQEPYVLSTVTVRLCLSTQLLCAILADSVMSLRDFVVARLCLARFCRRAFIGAVLTWAHLTGHSSQLLDHRASYL